MYFKKQKLQKFLSFIFICSTLIGNFAYQTEAQDIVQYDEFGVGASIFVFRGSRRKLQYDSSSARYIQRNTINRQSLLPRERAKKTIAVKRKKPIRNRHAKIKSVRTAKTLAAKNSLNPTNVNKNPVSIKQKTNANDAPEKWFDKAVANYNRGDFVAAVADYKQVIALDETHPDAHANLASAYRQLERYAEANAEYKIAAGFIKDDADLFSEWGFCLGQVGEWTKAIARLATAGELSPDAIDYANLGWAYYNAALKDSAAQDRTAAADNLLKGKTFLRQAVEMNPRLAAARLNLGLVCNELGEYQNAVEVLSEAVNLRNDWLPAINELGVAYRKSDKLAEAVAQFQKATRLDSNFARGFFNLGEAQYQLGRKKDAKQTLERLKSLDADLAEQLSAVISSAKSSKRQNN